LTFVQPDDYDKIDQEDQLEMPEVIECLKTNTPITVKNLTKGLTFLANYILTTRQKEILMKGGMLNFIKSK